MRCVYVCDKYGTPYVQFRRLFKHWDFQLRSDLEVASPLTGEILPFDFEVLRKHIAEFSNLKPVNRPM